MAGCFRRRRGADGIWPISFCATRLMSTQDNAWRPTCNGFNPAISAIRSIASIGSGRSEQPSSTAAEGCYDRPLPIDAIDRIARSEEHTSELQSHLNLVCRLLLEKNK